MVRPQEMGNMVSNVLIIMFLKAECRKGREDEVGSMGWKISVCYPAQLELD